jgi:hypothetical protein
MSNPYLKYRWMYIPLALLTWQCSDDARGRVDVEAAITAQVETRIREFKQVQWDNCRKRAQDEALLIADSIMLERAMLQRDTSYRPARPVRPEDPEPIIFPADSLRLQRLFDTLR